MTLYRTQNNIPGKSLTDGTIPMPSHPHCRPTSQPLEAAWWLPWSGFSQESFAGALCYVVCCAMSSLQWPDFPQMIHRLCWFAWKNSFCSYNECIVDHFVSHKFIYLFFCHCVTSDCQGILIWPPVFSSCVYMSVFVFVFVHVTLQASCLCSSAPCLLSSCCPAAYNSTVSRLAFSFFLLLGTMVSVIMILPGMESQLKKVSFLQKC